MTYFVIKHLTSDGIASFWTGEMWHPDERRALHYANRETANEAFVKLHWSWLARVQEAEVNPTIPIANAALH